MSTLHVEAEATTRATTEILWPLLADATAYEKWGPWNASGYEDPGASRRATGVIRWMRLGRTTTYERVVELDEGKRLAYTVVRGIPVRNYRAVVTLTPADAGTHIDWRATWDSTLLGRIVQWKLRKFYPEMMASLVAAAEAQVSSMH